MVATAPQLHPVSIRSTARIISVDCRGWLDAGELLTGTPTIGNITALSPTNPQVSTTELTIDGETVAIGQAILFTIDPSGGTKDVTYSARVQCSTSAGQDPEGICKIRVRD